MENKMLFTELGLHSFEKEKAGSIEIKGRDFKYSGELECYILKSTEKLLDGKYYITDMYQICYFKNGKWHRDDNLPAVIWNSGSLHCYINGISHRIDGPSEIYPNGDYYWYINDSVIDNNEMDNWLNENNIPLDWNLWTDLDKFYFALHWSDYNGTK